MTVWELWWWLWCGRRLDTAAASSILRHVQWQICTLHQYVIGSFVFPPAQHRHFMQHYITVLQSAMVVSSFFSNHLPIKHRLAKIFLPLLIALSTLTLLMPSVLWRCWLGGRKGIRPVKNWAVWCWRGYLSGSRCRLAYGPADTTATQCLLLQ